MLFYYIMGMSKNTDVLIVGSGIAGLSAALMLPSDVKNNPYYKRRLKELFNLMGSRWYCFCIIRN